MLPTPPQSDAGAVVGAVGGGGEEEFGQAIEFHNWAAKGAADLILPELEENYFDDDNNDDDFDDFLSNWLGKAIQAWQPNEQN